MEREYIPPPPPPPNAAAEANGVDERIWKACAGSLVQPPVVNSRVYYFPQGHVEQPTPSIPLSSFSPAVTSKPFIHCRVEHVSLLADVNTDEVFAKIRLQPLNILPEHSRNFGEHEFEGSENNRVVLGVGGGGGDENDVVSFAKVLTPSDANNGGGFSVPRFCADSIFPPLDFDADPPVQTLRITDIHGNSWEFRHIYRGTPRRHLLTTGWSKFVNSKKLVAGDTVVFTRKNASGELFVGVRRAVRPKAVMPVAEGVYGNLEPPPGYVKKNKGREKVIEVVVEAAERAARGVGFEVVYYPKPGVAEFVVAAERVERSLGVYWTEGVRVKMATETEDSSRLQWFQGTVVAVSVRDSGLFRGSTWHMLEVKWDEHEILKNMNRVSPWQVEFIPPTPPIHTTFPPTKKLKYSTNSGLYDGEEEFPLPSVGFSSMMSQLGPSFLNHNSFPAGMQGARQSNFFISNLPNISNTNGTHQLHRDIHVDSVSERANGGPIDLNAGKTPSEDTPSPDSQNSVQFFCTAGSKQKSPGLTKEVGITSFQLFGKTIHMEKPLNSIDEISTTEYDDCGAKGAATTMDHPMANSYKKLHDKIGTQCESPPLGGFVNG
ncbi:auxin response factor 17-like [Silene latifolia]|uniref:auxin response factor 17-like n=1 Tax=Silene latifolia TaxID=37657 RepID=UPI003D77EEA1